jgi:predicted sulfurtransferase
VPEVFELWRTLRDVGSARLAEVDRLVESYFTDRDEFEAVDKEELLRLLNDEAVIVIDVRPELEYEQGHIPAARSVPVENLKRRLAELPQDVEIVA